MADSMWDDFDTDFDKIGTASIQPAQTAATSTAGGDSSSAAESGNDDFGGSFDFPLPTSGSNSKGDLSLPPTSGGAPAAAGAAPGLDDFFDAAFDVGGGTTSAAAAPGSGGGMSNGVGSQEPQSGISTVESQKVDELERTVQQLELLNRNLLHNHSVSTACDEHRLHNPRFEVY